MRIEDRRHAIVVGASIGGLLAARVLAEYFDSVTILERDRFPDAGEHRRGVPQSRHTHGLLASGRQILGRLFPGLAAELMRAGAIPADIVRDGRWIHEGGCLKRFRSGLNALLVSRPLLEETIRSRVLAFPNVRICEDSHVTELVTNGYPARVRGVRSMRNGEIEILTGDLVVDATGRGSRSGEWLEAMQYPAPAIEQVKIGLGYATRLFRRRSGHLNGDLLVVIATTPESKRGGVILAQEGGRWTVTLTARFGNYPPEDLEGFREFARSLPTPDIYEVVRDAEPIGEPRSARFPASIRRRYEDLKRFPEGYLVFGDSICSFNPMYGQGMSVAALEAMALQEILAEGCGDLARRFFRRASKVIDIPWSIAVGGDLRIPETIGARTPQVKLINWYMSKLHKAAHHDPVPSLAFHMVANLLAPPPSVMRPKVAVRVLKGNWRFKNSGCGATATLPTGS